MIKKLLILMFASVFMLAGCSTSPSSKNPNDTNDNALNICILATTDVHDGNFLENCYDGILQFTKTHTDCTVTDVVETDFDKIVPKLEEIIPQYDVYVLPGYVFTGIGDIVKNNPNKKFIVIDTIVNDSQGNPVNSANMYTMRFREEESGFYAGVAAAIETKTNKVAVVNGLPLESNIDYQYGFMSGVEYSNKHFGTTAEWIELPQYEGVTEQGKKVGGNYIGNFIEQEKGKEVGNALIAKGVDVLFVAAGNAGNGVFTAAKETDNVRLIGSDADLYDFGAKGDTNIMLTSVYKLMDWNILRQLTDIYNGFFIGQDDVLDSGTNSTGYVKKDGRHNLSELSLQKLDICHTLIKDGAIIPPSAANGYTPTDFPGLN